MPTHDLRDCDTVNIDLGIGNGVLTVVNLSNTHTSIFVDYFDGRNYSAITGEKKLAPGGLLNATRVELGHDHVRVGAQGQEGPSIAKLSW